MVEIDLKQARATATTVAENVALPFHQKTWRGMTGEFAGSGTGSSLDFQDHRHYSPGDDPRHINWQAYARTGNYTMKLYRQEVRPILDVIMDVSPSMFFEASKGTRAAELLYLVIASGIHASASTQCYLSHSTGYQHILLEHILTDHWFNQVPPKEKQSQAPNLELIPLRANSMRVFISDLLFPGEPKNIMSHLARDKGSAIILSPFNKSESHPDWDGNYDFIDAETGTEHSHRILPSQLKQYKESYSRHFSLWSDSAAKFQGILSRVDASQPLMQSLMPDAIRHGALTLSH